MKTKFLRHLGATVLLLMAALGIQAQISTTDKFVVSGLESPAKNPYFTVGVEGSRAYSSYNLAIFLPKCVSYTTTTGSKLKVRLNHSDSMYAEDQEDCTHTISGSVQANPKEARVACFSGQNDEFLETSGALFNVFVEYNAWAKAGENEIRMTGLNLTTADATKFVPEGDLNTGTIDVPAEGREVAISISKAAKLGTCILPFAKADLPEGVKAYESAGISGDVLTLNEVTELEAYKPYILYAENGFTGKWTGTADAETFPETGVATENELCGVIEQTSVSEGYILQLHDGDTMAKFYRVGDTPFSLNAGRCYLSNVSASAPALRICFNDATGIKEMQDAESRKQNNAIYNLAGQRVLNPTSGTLYIIKGKKIIK